MGTHSTHWVTDFPSLSPFCSCKMGTTPTEPLWYRPKFLLRKVSRLTFCSLSAMEQLGKLRPRESQRLAWSHTANQGQRTA